MKIRLMAILLIIICTILISIAQVLFKFASSELSLDIQMLLMNQYLVAGLLVYVFAAAFLLAALRYGELSVLYPLVAISYIWVSVLSPLFFPDDYMNMLKWAGIFFIVIGVISVGLGGENE